jgi:hypothetical protein
MTSKERLLTVLSGDLPDCVPATPDFSNMIPARLTGKPFWDIYLYNDPPIWEAYIAAAKHFCIDAWLDDAAARGRFVLSTGDQCGRDTPDDNIHTLVETARTYGRY